VFNGTVHFFFCKVTVPGEGVKKGEEKYTIILEFFFVL